MLNGTKNKNKTQKPIYKEKHFLKFGIIDSCLHLLMNLITSCQLRGNVCTDGTYNSLIYAFLKIFSYLYLKKHNEM